MKKKKRILALLLTGILLLSDGAGTVRAEEEPAAGETQGTAAESAEEAQGAAAGESGEEAQGAAAGESAEEAQASAAGDRDYEAEALRDMKL
ncbi:MAG: hypothetical protein K2I07_11350, partial [Lachnospiraceae bacterium]|nr:hypothetical protein [Lachnospiraceae bacterium]